MKRFLILLISTFLACTANAQEKRDPLAGWGVEANIMAGKVLKHTKKFRADVPDLSTAYEINFTQQTYGTKDWQQRRGYPVLGFGIAYTNYGIDSIYGKCISIYPNLQVPIIRGKKIEWTFRAAFGLGYATRKYERYGTWDTLNTAIGSHFNNYTFFATDLRYRINKHWDVQIGGNFSHMSNAAFRMPNLGINLYGAHVGLRYFPVTSQPERIKKDLKPLKNRWLVQARVGISATELGPPDGPLYPIYLVSGYASKRYHSKNKVFAGIDYSYHSHIYQFLRNNEIHVGEEKANSWKGSIFAGHEFLFGHLGIMLQIGVYYKQPYLALDKYYQKLGGNVYLIQREKGFVKEMYASALLKTHKTQAELVEMGLGFGF
jgi:hypothetical protein